jgi:DNA-binding transcriptional LysR family regulator
VLEGLLASGRLDLSLLYERERPTRQVEERRLLVEDLFLVTRGRPGKKLPAEVTLAEAVRHRFILPGPTNTTRQMLERAARNVDLRLEVLAEVDSPWTTKALVVAGLGATVMSRSALYPETSRPALVVQRIVRPALSRPLNVCVGRAEAPARAAARVLEVVEETALDLVRRGHWKGAAAVGAKR